MGMGCEKKIFGLIGFVVKKADEAFTYTVTKYLVRLVGCRSWPQGFITNKHVSTYNVGRELFKV